MTNRRFDGARLAPRLALVLAAAALVACAQIAGLQAPDEASIDPATKAGRPDEPRTGAVGNEDKANTDSNAEDIAVTHVLDFGTVGCGDERTENLVVTNRSAEPRSYAVLLPEGAPFHTSAALEGMLPANGNVVVPIVARPTAAGEAKVNVVVTSGASFATVPAGVIGAGATLEWMTASADIGDTPLNTEGTTKARLKNTGVRAATVTGFLGIDVNFTASPTQLVLAPDAEADIELTLTKGGTATNKLTATFTPIATGLCAAPLPVTVSGQRVNTNVTVSGADWGKQDCNSTPTATRNVVVKNYSNKPLTWTVTAPPTRFALQGALTGTVPPSPDNGSVPGTADIPFKAPELGAEPGVLTDSVTVKVESTSGATLAAVPGGEYTVPLHVDVRGAVLAIAPTELTFVARQGYRSATKVFSITNTGNEPAALAWTFQRTAGGPAWIGNPQSTSTSAGRTTNVGISYQPSTAPPNTATLTPSRAGGGKICNPAGLAVVSLSGTEP